MRLEEYLKKEKISKEEFAKIAKVAIGTVYNILKGTVDIAVSIANKVMDATKGDVTTYDLDPTRLSVKKTTKKNKPSAKKGGDN